MKVALDIPTGTPQKIKTEDLKRALEYFRDHRVHIISTTLFNTLSDSYPPNDSDCSHPGLWKPNNWIWFLGRKEFPEEWVRAYGEHG